MIKTLDPVLFYALSEGGGLINYMIHKHIYLLYDNYDINGFMLRACHI